ncbi:SusD/RagB family nutrient-binding outer membrane lipoprotein [Capnocytophaga canimorsus]|uniref:SusD/RagB family nutrient-binding outer membrane lipoprotein n=1 Tax=Capnocytophaga canimorsus TaxID=28188 RepID=UPI0028ED1EBC|nr:SusD/RagB family nutrient-binding outer membrane lipoprotein [Capnocytophaga canimorsus]MDT9498475.1 SusD/RagB family nutrient-binding outer membrane lipoprotein [Capnocytophaga canimorsus]
MKRIIFTSLLLSVAVGCTSDFEEINTNAYGVTKSDEAKDGISYGAPFVRMQQLIIPIGPPEATTGPGNALQNTDLISSGNYIGYFGNNNNWGFRLEPSWNLEKGRMNYAYENFYSNFFQQWVEVKKALGDSEVLRDKQIVALAEILKVTAWLRATDVFGPIPYTSAGNGDIKPKLDNQKEVYYAMLSDLEKSLAVISSGGNILSSYDNVYNGDLSKWAKFANSLMLRIAVRMHFNDPQKASEYVAKAITGGVMTDVSDEAKMGSTSKMKLLNPMIASVNEYSETRMGLTMWYYLDVYKDPRADKYFTKGTYDGESGFFAVVPTSRRGKNTGIDTPEFASKPNVNESSPIYWLRTSEVLLLKAEAALYGLGGLTSSEAKDFYEQGVKMSFIENGLSIADAETYLKREAEHKSVTENEYDYFYSYDISENNVSPKWNHISGNRSLQEQQLQKIITQKYLAMYPNAVEAWTEYRRTGYPLIMKYADEQAPKRINCPDCFVPERFKYSEDEYLKNPNLTQLPSLLNGEDQGGTKLWWVRPNRPQQK